MRRHLWRAPITRIARTAIAMADDALATPTHGPSPASFSAANLTEAGCKHFAAFAVSAAAVALVAFVRDDDPHLDLGGARCSQLTRSVARSVRQESGGGGSSSSECSGGGGGAKYGSQEYFEMAAAAALAAGETSRGGPRVIHE